MAKGSESVEDLMKRLTNQLEMDEGKFEMTSKEGGTLEVRTLNSGSGDPNTLLPFLSKFAGKLDQSQDNEKTKRKENSEEILDIEASTKDEHVKRSEVESTADSLTDLVLQFRKDIKNSEWLKENTAEKWTSENPELAKEYMEAAKK